MKTNGMKIDKCYTIMFSLAGINQYQDFYEKNGKLVNPKLSVEYRKVDEIPDISDLETINEVLVVIKSISFCNRAEIYLIDGHPVNYHKNKKARKHINNFVDELEVFKKTKAIEFFESVLEPLMKKYEWFVGTSHIGFPVLIKKDENDEWDNVRSDQREFDFQYLCYMFIRNFDERVEFHLKTESSNYAKNCFANVSCLIPNEVFEEKKLYIDL